MCEKGKHTLKKKGACARGGAGGLSLSLCLPPPAKTRERGCGGLPAKEKRGCRVSPQKRKAKGVRGLPAKAKTKRKKDNIKKRGSVCADCCVRIKGVRGVSPQKKMRMMTVKVYVSHPGTWVCTRAQRARLVYSERSENWCGERSETVFSLPNPSPL